MNQPSKEARMGVRIYRLTAILSLALTFFLFISGTGANSTRTIVFVAWLALCAFSCIRVASDALSKQYLKAQRFENTIQAFTENSGGREAGVRTFYLTLALSALIKLAVPVVLWFIFR